VPPAAAAAAAKRKWRKLLCLAFDAPFDFFGQRQLQQMDQQASQETQHRQQQEQQQPPTGAHTQQQQQQQQDDGQPARDTAPADIETGLTNSPQDMKAGQQLQDMCEGPGSASKAPGSTEQQRSAGIHQLSTNPAAFTAQQQQQRAQQQQQGAKQLGKPQKQQRPDMLVLDLPWVYHWPKLLLWVLFEGCNIVLTVGESLYVNESELRPSLTARTGLVRVVSSPLSCRQSAFLRRVAIALPAAGPLQDRRPVRQPAC
jgi:hypothetical protein